MAYLGSRRGGAYANVFLGAVVKEMLMSCPLQYWPVAKVGAHGPV